MVQTMVTSISLLSQLFCPLLPPPFPNLLFLVFVSYRSNSIADICPHTIRHTALYCTAQLDKSSQSFLSKSLETFSDAS